MPIKDLRKTLYVWALHHEKIAIALVLAPSFSVGGAIYLFIGKVTLRHTDSHHLHYELMPVVFSFQMPSESKPPSYWFTVQTPAGQDVQIGTRSLVKAQEVTDKACVDVRERKLDKALLYRLSSMKNCT